MATRLGRVKQNLQTFFAMAKNGKMGKATPKAKPTKKSVPRRRVAPGYSLQHAVDARTMLHVAPSTQTPPYTVVRTRTPITFTTNIAGQDTVLLVGPHRNSFPGQATGVNDPSISEDNISGMLAVRGVGTNVPGTSEQSYSDPVVGTYVKGAVSLALHAFTVEIQCTDSATVATGLFFCGALSGRIRRSSYSTFNALATALASRRELRPVTAYSTINRGKVLVSYPVDSTEWSMLKEYCPADGVNLGANQGLDTMAVIAAVFPATATAINYIVTVHAEWRVVYHNDTQLSSTSTIHPPAAPSVWSNAVRSVSDAAGHVFDQAAGAAGGAIGAMASNVIVRTGLALEQGAMRAGRAMMRGRLPLMIAAP